MPPALTILDHDILDTRHSLKSKVQSLGIKQLRQQCAIFGIVTGTCNRRDLLSMLAKFGCQPVIYEGFAHQELLNFVISRGLSLSEAAQQHLDTCTTKCKDVARANTLLETAMNVERKSQDQGQFAAQAPLRQPSLRRSSRIAAKVTSATEQDPSCGSTNRLTMTVRSSASKVVHDCPRKALRRSRFVFKAAERRSKDSLVEILEDADRELQFDLLGLPFELRNMVFYLVCISSTTIVQPTKQPAIAQTCQLLRDEALSVYYGYNRFSVLVGKPGSPSYLPKNPWFETLQPCYLASVRSISFMYLGIAAIFDVDFDIRGQKFSIVRHGLLDRAHSRQQLRFYWTQSLPNHCITSFTTMIRCFQTIRWGGKRSKWLPYTQSSSSLLKAFNTAVTNRVSLASVPASDDACTFKEKEWRLLGREWSSRKGFSASSIQRIAQMLVERGIEIKSLWTDDFEDESEKGED